MAAEPDPGGAVPKAPANGLATVALIVCVAGWLTAPLGLLAVAWAVFVALVIVVTNRRDARPVPRTAYATLLACVLFAAFCHGSP